MEQSKDTLCVLNTCFLLKNGALYSLVLAHYVSILELVFFFPVTVHNGPYS